jgi:hypothetical protein
LLWRFEIIPTLGVRTHDPEAGGGATRRSSIHPGFYDSSQGVLRYKGPLGAWDKEPFTELFGEEAEGSGSLKRLGDG